MTRDRSIWKIGARTLFGALATTAVVAFTAAALVTPLPEVRQSAPSTVVTPQPAAQERVCPGPLLTIAANATDANAVSPIGEAGVVAGAQDPGRTVETMPLTGVDPDGTAVPTAIRVTVDPAEATAPLLAGSQSQALAGDELSGLAATECQEATPESWLVAGSTDVGRTTLIMLINPSPVAATVDIQVAGAEGPVEITGASGLIVEPASQRVIPLAGLAPDVDSPVVHITSRGGKIAAWLQHSVVRGLRPGGIELVGHAAWPAGRQVIPGVHVVQNASGISNDTGRTLNDAEPILRVHSVSDQDGDLVVRVLSEKTGQGTVLNARVAAGAVADLPIEDLQAGTYTVVVEASSPIVAAVRGNTSGDAALDFAWFQAGEALAESFLVEVPAGPQPRLHVANQGDQNAEVTLTPIKAPGSEVALTVNAGASVSTTVAAGGQYLVTGPAGLYASVSYLGDGMSSSFPISAISPLATPITVYRG